MSFGLSSFWPRSRWDETASLRVDEEDRAALEQGGTLLLPMFRERLLRYLPLGGRVAEIGVARGRFSSKIRGHDFAVHAAARSSRFGVIQAVHEFVEETGYKLVAVTVEHFPTFVVAKNPAGATVQKLRQLVFAHEPHVIQVADWEQAAVSHAGLMTATPRSAFFSLTFPRAIS